jgi:hypothetical protein
VHLIDGTLPRLPHHGSATSDHTILMQPLLAP